MKFQGSILFILLLVFNSCSSDEKNHSEVGFGDSEVDIVIFDLDDFMDVKSLKAEAITSEFSLVNPKGIMFLENSLIILDRSPSSQIVFIDIDSMTISHQIGSKGLGPGELMAGVSLNRTVDSHRFEVFDLQMQKINTYNIDEKPLLANEQDDVNSNGSVFYHALWLSDSTLLGVQNSMSSVFVEFGISGGQRNEIGNWHKFGIKGIPSGAFSSVFQGKLFSDFDKKHFLFSSIYMKTMALYSRGNGVKYFIGPGDQPKFNVSKKHNTLVPDFENGSHSFLYSFVGEE